MLYSRLMYICSRFLASLNRVAEINAVMGNYEAALNTWTRILSASTEDRALQFRTNQYLFLQGLCVLGMLVGLFLFAHTLFVFVQLPSINHVHYFYDLKDKNVFVSHEISHCIMIFNMKDSVVYLTKHVGLGTTGQSNSVILCRVPSIYRLYGVQIFERMSISSFFVLFHIFFCLLIFLFRICLHVEQSMIRRDGMSV
jgi:hypothetical protein